MPHSQADMRVPRRIHTHSSGVAVVWLCTSWLSANHILIEPLMLINQAMKVFQT